MHITLRRHHCALEMARPRRPQIPLVRGNRPPFITAAGTTTATTSTSISAASGGSPPTPGAKQRTDTCEPAKKRTRHDDDAGRDEAAILSQQLSTLATSRAVLPPTSSAVQFELMMRYPVVFPWLDHTRPAIIEAFMQTLSPNRRTPSSPLPLANSRRLTPARDRRLARLRISCWLRVSIPNGLAAALLAHYLDHDNLTLGFFNGDLFLDDLTTGITGDFCSPFLVASVLYFASVSRVRSLFVDGFSSPLRDVIS